MIEYAKAILPKISCSRQLFRKELIKCISWMENTGEFKELENWCYANFKDTHNDVLDEAFSVVMAA